MLYLAQPYRCALNANPGALKRHPQQDGSGRLRKFMDVCARQARVGIELPSYLLELADLSLFSRAVIPDSVPG